MAVALLLPPGRRIGDGGAVVHEVQAVEKAALAVIAGCFPVMSSDWSANHQRSTRAVASW